MSAFLSLVLASALTASAGVSSPSYPIRETAEATADSSSSSNDPLHPTYVVESDLHDVWKAASQKERPLVDEFDYDSVSDNSVIERSVSLMDHDRDCFLGNYTGFTSRAENVNLYQPWGMMDTDYYTFSLYADSAVSIACDAAMAMDSSGNVVTGRSFDFALYELTYGAHVNDTYEKEIRLLFSETDDSVSFSGILTTGTYYIMAAHTVAQASYNDIEYSLTVNADYLHASKSYDINDLRYNKGIKAAIWSSDFHPFQKGAFSDLTYDGLRTKITTIRSENCFQESFANHTPHNKRDYAAEDLEEVLSGRTVYSDILYVWDNDVAAVLRDCFRSFAIEFDKKGNEIIAKAKQEENILKVTEIVYEARKDSLTVTLELLDLYFNIAVPLSSVVTDVVIPIVEKIIDMVFSSLENQYGAEAESGTDMLQIAQYFRQFASALDVKADSANADGAPEKVLFFPLSAYRLERRASFLGDDESGWYISGAQPLVEKFNAEFAASLSQVYGEDTIRTTRNDVVPLIGNIYAFDTQDGSTRDVDFFPDVMHPCQTLSLNPGNTININRGDYAWYHFVNSDVGQSFGIYVVNPDPVCIEPYPEQIIGFSPDSRKEAALTGTVMLCGEKQYYTFYDFYLPKGGDIYFRISSRSLHHLFGAFTLLKLELIQEVATDDYGNHFLQDLHVHELTFYYDYNPFGFGIIKRPDPVVHYHTCWKKDYAVSESHEFGEPYEGKDGKTYSSCLYCQYTMQFYSANLSNPFGNLPIINI